MPPENRKRRVVRSREPDTSSWSKEERRAHRQKTLLETPVAEMKLAVRVINTLEDNNVILAQDLMRQSYDSLMGMKNFGDKTLREVRAALAELGLEPPAWDKPPKPKKIPKPKGKGKAVIKFW